MSDNAEQPEEMEVDEPTEDAEEEADEESEEGGSSSESEDIELPEPLATTRSRRANAGNKMKELMSTAKAEDTEEYYTSSKGKYDFKETEADEEYSSPPSSEDEDDVDSDFDRDENEEEPAAEEDEETRLRREARRERKAKLKKHKQWAVARLAGKIVPANTCDPKTQAERLKESEQTEKLNIESLKRFEELELERKKRQTKQTVKRTVVGPTISYISTPDATLAVYPEVRQFPQKKKIYPACAVTGKPAKYIDPITDLPYCDVEAFKVIRRAYAEFLATHAPKEVDGTAKENVSA